MSLKGHAQIPLEDLRALLNDPEVKRNERTIHFRLLLNGRVLREFRYQAFAQHHTLPVDLTWLLGEIYQREDAGERGIDLRLEVTPET